MTSEADEDVEVIDLVDSPPPKGGGNNFTQMGKASLSSAAVATKSLNRESASGGSSKRESIVIPGGSKVQEIYRCVISVFPELEEASLVDRCKELVESCGDDSSNVDSDVVAQLVIDELSQMTTHKKRSKRSATSDPSSEKTKGMSSRKKQKQKATEDDVVVPLDQVSEERAQLILTSLAYSQQSLEALSLAFPQLAIVDIRLIWYRHRRLFAPSYLHLRSKLKSDPTALRSLKCGRKRLSVNPDDPLDEIGCLAHLRAKFGCEQLHEMFMEEVLFVYEYVRDEAQREYAEQNEDKIECGCCYMDCLSSRLVHCEEGHLFCKDCVKRLVEENLGLYKVDIKCMFSDGDPCTARFSANTLQELLPEKSWKLYERIAQEHEIKMAFGEGVVGGEFVTCPFCPFGMVIESTADEDKIFRCFNPECSVESCRKCKRENHLPKSCDEAMKDDAVTLQHRLEEAMTNALLRECSKCKQKFFKTEGCNKMRCSCGTTMCYICRMPNVDYNHFGKKCPLWDDSVQRNAEEVVKAAEAAVNEIVEDEDEGVEEFQKELDQARLELVKDLKEKAKPKAR